MDKIFITGGCGFIGRNLVHYLLEKNPNPKIRLFDNLSTGTRKGLASVCQFEEITPDLSQNWSRGVQLITGNILDQKLCKVAMEGAEAVVHLAANTGVTPSIDNPYMDFQSNVVGSLNILEAAKTCGVQKFVFASSGAPLGNQIPPIHEEMNPKPISPYGASKLAGEAYCSAYHGSYGLGTISLRFGNVYGPFSEHKESVVAKFAKQMLRHENLVIYGDGEQTRDFIFSSDLCSAIYKSIVSGDIGGEVFQIATQKEHKVREVAELLNSEIFNRIGFKSKIMYQPHREGEVMRNFFNIKKARNVLNWQPSTCLEVGLEKLVDWFQENYW